MENSNNRYKFRAWQTHHKEMYQPFIGYIEFPDIVVGFDDGDLRLEGEKNVILMQSTGLKDCKGNDVYESDIVMVDSYEFFKCKEVDVIEFRRGGFYVGNGDDFSSLSNVADMNGVLRGEVVGNLYENPELLIPAKD